MKIGNVLIANRGEIASRVARTARKMGIRTVGVHSRQDAHTKAMREVDQAIALPGGDLSQNYLNAELLVQTAVRSKVNAIHPGYGFLAENPDFAERIQEAGLIWIGPSPDAMRQIGDKMRAKEIAGSVGVPVAPWKQISGNPDKQEIKSIVNDIGLPALIKATRGGGGRGQRIVRDASQFEEALRTARSEALRSFGSGELFLERFLENPRHIEVQIIGDRYKHLFALGERDCSLQRRNQKVVEETPAAILDDKTRTKLHSAAISLATAAGYSNAGTIEFLVQRNTKGQWEFFFMEMNARLQVEHPVTEMVWGVDLVELQFRVAEGEALEPFLSNIHPSGHAIELRLCAEDPSNHFLPTPGPITELRYPDDPLMRIDSGYDEGDTIPQEYDSLFSKVIVHSDDRKKSISKASEVLEKTTVAGVITNKYFLQTVLQHGDFQKNLIHTRWIESHPELTATGNDLDAELLFWGKKLSSELFVQRSDSRPYEKHEGILRSFEPDPELHGTASLQGLIRIAGTFETDSEGSIEASGWITRFELCISFEHPVRGIGQRRFAFAGQFEVEEAKSHRGPIVAQVPGVVLDVRAKVNEVVDAQEPILVVEAMKIEMPMTLPVPARITAIHVKQGDRIKPGQTLVTWEPAA
jgi:acetyl/propionyl-CoA carboxylase alpha subunit